MTPEASSRHRLSLTVPALLALLAAVMFGGAGSAAQAKQPQLPKLYKGNGYSSSPA